MRPGLQFSKQQKREHALFKKREETRPKPFSTLAEERLHEGLHTALPESNKGFSLLAKMGYKPGTGVGKSATGTSEPINIDLKKGTSGLGFGKSIKKERKSDYAPSTEEYRDMLKKRQEINHMKVDFSKTRSVCYFLDKKVIKISYRQIIILMCIIFIRKILIILSKNGTGRKIQLRKTRRKMKNPMMTMKALLRK